MTSWQEHTKAIVNFAEQSEKYHGKKVKIFESISTNKTNFDRHCTTLGHYELQLERVSLRVSGSRLTLWGEHGYYEICVHLLEDFKETKRDSFEFLEAYSETVFRMTILEFLT